MQPQNSQEALAQLQTTRSGQKSASDILAQQQQQFGVQQAGDTVAGLRGAIASTTKLLNQVAPSVMGRTANSLVTNAQATRQIANEQQPIAQQISQYGQDYTAAQGDYDRALGQATQGANAQLTDQENQLSFLQNIYNSLFQREAAAEEKRRFDESLALQKRAASTSGIGSYFGGSTGGGTTPASGAKSTDPLQQIAYNDVATRLAQLSDAELVSDFKATQASANYGNPKDKFKVALYQQLRPDLFTSVGAQYGRYFATAPPNQSAPVGVSAVPSAGVKSITGRTLF